MTEHKSLQPTTALQAKALEEAAARYEAGMTSEAAAYLLGRGLTQETVVSARLGVVVDPIPAHEHYRGWLAIPYLVKGQVVRIRFRRPDWIDTTSHKYGQPSGETIRTYGIDSIHAAQGELHITEGEFDRLILVQAGFHAIAFPGSNTFKGYHGRMLAGFNKLFVWGDPDPAGAEFVTKVLQRMPMSGRHVQLRDGDVTDTYLAGGQKALNDAWKKAV